jgi:hypothetical protein
MAGLFTIFAFGLILTVLWAMFLGYTAFRLALLAF